jgi:hypothetical protein
VAVLPVGDGNVYRHPTADCFERLHLSGVKTYWTETENGAEPDPAYDTVAKNIVVEVEPAAQSFTLTPAGGSAVSSPIGATGASAGGAATTPVETQYAWSKNSNVYHYANCKYVQNISPANLECGTTPPAGKKLHPGCPK